YVEKINARQIGIASQHLGAGRASKEDEIDLSAGIVLNKKVGDRVEEGDLLLTLMGNDLTKLENGRRLSERAFQFSDEPVKRPELIKEIIGL
ncbi:MAG: pyrimidine-nucleoside phosphorylase, partial [Firmicutes bacterium]|nr:pyrimidine-nucleoside phosphorylase [Bacillota bacterium]